MGISLLVLVETNLRFFVMSEARSSVTRRIIVPWRGALVAETKAALERLKVTVDASSLGLKLQPFLLHSLFLVSILVTSKRL